jgi:phosphomannomutase/phosphoglucomutase
VVEEDFDDDFVIKSGRAYATLLIDAGQSTITLGRDCRLTSDALRDLPVEGLLPAGSDLTPSTESRGWERISRA